MIYRLHRTRSMQTTTSLLKRVTSGAAAVLIVIFMPVAYVFADSADVSTPPASTCSPVATPPQGTQSPTGADAAAFTYNSCTGLWESAHYTWNPISKAYAPKDEVVYTCNVSNWQWDYQVWVYSPVQGAYKPVTYSTSSLPAGGVVASGSLNPCTAAIANPGPGSTNTTSTTDSSFADLGSTTAATINNNLDSKSATGDASILSNTLGGSATTGNAIAVANLINSVASSSALNLPGVLTFTANINGDVQGNLIVDPSQLQPATGTDALNNKVNDLTVHTQDSGTINNNLNLAATSGNANVTNNTKAGNATSGNAAAVADVMNTLNSMVSAGQSFVGVININGNFNGNVLIPQNFMDELLATNAPHATMALSNDQTNQLNLHANNNQAINNAVLSSATTGTSAVDHNTAAGSATSGNASTKVTIFNLTGAQVVGANSLLVFVNVSGQWVGVIMNAPQGATAAALGGGINSSSFNNFANIAPTTNQTIINHINVGAASGNASVMDNTDAGNARTGNADTAVNLLNMENSSLNLSGWFGILFINVFGNWYGSVGVLTQPPVPSISTGQQQDASPGGRPPAVHKVFQFVDNTPTYTTTTTTDAPPLAAVGAHLVEKAGKVLGSATSKPYKASSAFNQFQVIGGILLLFSLGLVLMDRAMRARDARTGV